MKVVRQFADLALSDRGAVVALGNFDGVHLGHQEVLAVARRIARSIGAPFGVVCFEPHPREFFRPEGEDFRLTPLPVKARVLGQFGVDRVYALPFDPDMASKLSAEFVEDVLVKGLGIVHAVIGYDFRFGQGRAGSRDALAYMGEMEGFGVTIVEPVTLASSAEIYSSTFIRDCLKHGKPRDAARHLGRPWAIQGRVRRGDQRGRTIGFPTINVALDGYLKPALGVYAVQVELLGEDQPARRFMGVANIGKRPTFNKTDIVLEVFLFDFDGDLYDREVSVELIDFIRYEKKFDGLESLKAQIERDKEVAANLLCPPAASSLR